MLWIRHRFHTYPIQENPHRQENYLQYFEEEGLLDIEYPVNPVDIPQLEKRLNISINLFSYFDDIGKTRHPMYKSRHNSPIHIDLLYFKQHYAWIRTLFGYSVTWLHMIIINSFASVALENLEFKVHTSVISTSAHARVTSPRFTFSRRPTAQ